MKNKKLWITASIICIVLGAVLAVAGRLMGGHAGFYIDQNGVHAAGHTNIPEPVQDSMTLDEFDSIEIQADYADVELILSDEYSVEYRLMGTHGKPVCEVRNGRFIFQETRRSPSFNMGFFTGSFGSISDNTQYFVKVKIPKKSELAEAVFDVESGNLAIPALQADTLKIENDYGDVRIDRYKGSSLHVLLESGTLSLGTVEAGQTDLANEYGISEISQASGKRLDIRMESCDLKAGRLDYSNTEISNDYGNINIEEASGEGLTARMESCDCNIDQMDFSDAEITASYGNIILGLPGETEDYGLNLKTEYGDICVGNQKTGDSGSGDEVLFTTTGDSRKNVTVSCENGDIQIRSAR